MKTIIRTIAIYTLILFLLPKLVAGFTIDGGLFTLFVSGVVLSMLFMVVRPILSIISFPVNVVSLGLFNIFINALLLYLLTIFVTGISVVAFTMTSVDILGFIIPQITFNTFFAYLYTAFILTIFNSFIRWLMN